MECWFSKEVFLSKHLIILCQYEFYQYPTLPFSHNPWPRPCRNRFRFTMAKFENVANNILNHLSRTRAGHYSNIPIAERS